MHKQSRETRDEDKVNPPPHRNTNLQTWRFRKSARTRKITDMNYKLLKNGYNNKKKL